MRLRVHFLLLLEVSLHTAVSSTIRVGALRTARSVRYGSGGTVIECWLPSLPTGVDRRDLMIVYKPGEDAVLSCAPGYSHAGGSRVIVCSNTGEWSTITFKCAPAFCPAPTEIPNGFIPYIIAIGRRRVHSYHDSVEYVCNRGYVMDGRSEVKCETTGQWSAKPVCRAPCSVNFGRGRIFLKYEHFKSEYFDKVLHLEYADVYCRNEEKECDYTVTSRCVDGSLEIPGCFKDSLPSEINMCDKDEKDDKDDVMQWFSTFFQ